MERESRGEINGLNRGLSLDPLETGYFGRRVLEVQSRREGIRKPAFAIDQAADFPYRGESVRDASRTADGHDQSQERQNRSVEDLNTEDDQDSQ